MMRSPKFIAVAVRKPNGAISIKSEPYASVSVRYPFLKKPVLRGVVTLVESMVQGIHALSHSANVAADEENTGEKLSTWAMVSSIASAFALGIGLFVVLPHFVTAVIASHDSIQVGTQSPLFHLVDGFFKMIILLAYVYLIALMNDIKRVFQYHGAEHKSIYAFEAGEELTAANARKHPALHPRCGTSFLLFLVLISILVFSAVFPIFGLNALSPLPVVNHALMILIKILLMLPVAGLAYEFIKYSANKMQNPFFKIMVWPGLWLQNLTTRTPDDSQLEVALASLRQVLKLEKAESGSAGTTGVTELEIRSLDEILDVHAPLKDFQEA